MRTTRKQRRQEYHRQKKRFFNRRSIFRWAVIAILVGAMGLNLLFTVPSLKPALFNGYCTVFYRGKIPLGGIISRLEKQADIRAVISRESAETIYTNFSGFEKIGIKKINERFDENDPRLDDYMKKIGRYFYVRDGNSSWDIFYVRTSRNPLYLSLLLQGLVSPDGGEWHIYELDTNILTVILPLAGSIFFLLLMLVSKRFIYHLLFFFGTLPWVNALARGGLYDFLFFFFIAYLWAFFVQEFVRYLNNEILDSWADPDKRPLMTSSGLYVGIVIITFFFTAFYKSDVVEITIALFLQGCLLGLYFAALKGCAFLGAKNKIRVLRHFQPLILLRALKPENARPFKKGAVRHAIIIMLAFIPCSAFFQGSAQKLMIPVPQAGALGKGMSLEAIHILANREKASALPDLSDFIRHAAYQERLAFGPASYDLPRENDEIILSEYKLNRETQKIERMPRPLIRFDNGWLGRLSSIVSETSIEKMLFDQGECMSVSFNDTAVVNIFSGSLWTILVIWCIVLCPIIIFNYTPVPQFIYGLKRDFISVMRKMR